MRTRLGRFCASVVLVPVVVVAVFVLWILDPELLREWQGEP